MNKMQVNPVAGALLLSFLVVIVMVFVVSFFIVGGYGGTAEDDTEPAAVVSMDDVPGSVANSTVVATSFHTAMEDHYNGVRVFVEDDGGIVLSYTSSAESESELESQVSMIAIEYIDHVNNNTTPHLTIVTGGVGFVVPEATVTAYKRGDINEEAYLETIEAIGVE